MKRVFVLFFVILIWFGIPFHAHAEIIYDIDDETGLAFSYDTNADWNFATITGIGNYNLSSSHLLKIRDKVIIKGGNPDGSDKLFTVNAIGDGAFQNIDDYFRLEIPDTLRSIGNSAFKNSGLRDANGGGLLDLKEVEIIGDSAFEGCTGLINDLNIPNKVKTIGNSAFKNCTGLHDNYNAKLNLGNSVETIGDSAFENTGFQGTPILIIPPSVKSIGNSAFKGGYVDEEDGEGIMISQNVTSIGSNIMDAGYYLYTYDSVYEKFKGGNSLPEDHVKIFLESIESEITIKVGEKFQLQNLIKPSTASYSFEFDEPYSDIITVDSEGLVTGIKEGTTKIDLYIDDILYYDEETHSLSSTYNYPTVKVIVDKGTAPTPTNTPTTVPSNTPTTVPSNTPTTVPTNTPTTVPSNTPTTVPSNTPTTVPSNTPTTVPSNTPTTVPSNTPTTVPSNTPTTVPTFTPTMTATVGPSISVPVKASLQTGGSKGAPADLDSKKLKLVLTVKQNSATYKSQELAVDTQTLSEGSLDFNFPSGTPTFVWGAEVSLKGFSGTVKDKNNNYYQLSGVADINGQGDISVVLNFSKKAGGGKKTHGYPAWDLPEDEIGAYHIDPVTGQKEYLMFQTYNICMKYMKNDEYCASYEHCFHKEEVNYEINWKK